MSEAELNHFDSIVGKQAKVAELQARVMGEYLWGVGTVLRFTSTPTHSRRLRRPPMTSAERVEKIADICATSVMVDVDLLREVSDIARTALEERDGYKAQLVETLKAHNENGEVLARLNGYVIIPRELCAIMLRKDNKGFCPCLPDAEAPDE